MDDDEDDRNHFHSIEPKSIVKQEDDQKTISNIDPSVPREREKMTSNRRRVRVKFAYSFDNDRALPITQTTVIKTEPCFKVTATEDQLTKNFYENKPEEQNKTQSIEQKTPSEVDSLEDEYSSQLINDREITSKMFDGQPPVPQRRSSSPLKSILKKPQKKEEKNRSVSKTDRSLKSRSSSASSFSSSSSSSKKKATSSTRLDFNEVQHLAEITAKQNIPSPSFHCRSLFDQTINIFDPNNSYRTISTNSRPSRLQYYIKPYRGEANVPTTTNQRRSRSLPQQLRTTNGWDTSSNKHVRSSARQSYRKQHISRSPHRDYIYYERDNTIITPTKRERTLSDKSNSSLLSINSSLSLSNPYLPNISSTIPLYIPHRTSRLPPSPLSTDSYYTPSIIDRPVTSSDHQFQYSFNKEETKDIVDQHKKEHDETIHRYDRLLEQMRTTDEQLQSLSESWTNNTQERTPVSNNYLFLQQVKMDRSSTLSLNKMTNDGHFFSPMILQMCLIILVIFNLLVVYFFHEINVWWSENIAPGMIVEQHKEDILNF